MIAFKKILSLTAYFRRVVGREHKKIHAKNVILKSQKTIALENIASIDLSLNCTTVCVYAFELKRISFSRTTKLHLRHL